jgi:hypothetical protein
MTERLERPATGSTLAFGHAVVVDHQRVTGEPSLTVSPTLNTHGYHDIYVSAPYGFSTTASFIWRSGDGGKTFHPIGDEFPPIGNLRSPASAAVTRASPTTARATSTSPTSRGSPM